MKYTKLLITLAFSFLFFVLTGCNKNVAIYDGIVDSSELVTLNNFIDTKPILITNVKVSKDLFKDSGRLSFKGFNGEVFKGNWSKTSFDKHNIKLIDYGELPMSTMTHMGYIVSSKVKNNKGISINIELIEGTLNPYSGYGVAKTSYGKKYKFIVQ